MGLFLSKRCTPAVYQTDVSVAASVRHDQGTMMPNASPSARWLWFGFRACFAALAVWVAVTERRDIDGDGRTSFDEVLLFVVRFLAFPLHILLRLTPTSALHSLGLPMPTGPPPPSLQL